MGPKHGWVRLARTGVFALVCLFLAAGAHALAGGGLPPLGVLLLACVPLWFGAFWLTARRLGAGSIGIALGLAQAALHVVFHVTTASTGHTAATAATAAVGHSGHAGLSGHLAHLGPATLSQSTSPGGARGDLLAGPSVTMVLAHVVATIACALLLSYGEDVVWRLMRRLFRLPPSAQPPATAPLWQVHARPLRARDARRRLTGPRRGPPVLSAS